MLLSFKNFNLKFRYLVFLLCFFACLGTLSAQDIIVLQDGNEVTAKVLEVTSSEIKYKLYSNLEGPVYVLDKGQIFLIKYASGTKEVFGTQQKSYDKKSTELEPAPAPASAVEVNPSGYSSSKPKEKSTAHRYEKRHYIAINPLGLGIPFGKFASTDSTGGSVNSGFATFGYSGNIEGAYFPHQNIGVCAHLGVTTNGVDDSRYQTYLKNLGYNWTFKTGVWTSTYILAGPIASVPFKNSSLDFKFLVGFMGVSSPYYDYRGTFSGLFISLKQSSATAESVALMPGMSYRLLFSNRVGFKFNLDVLFTNSLQFTSTYTVGSNINGVPTGSADFSYSFPVSTVNLSAGIFVGLWK